MLSNQYINNYNGERKSYVLHHFLEDDLYRANTVDLVSYLESWDVCVKKLFTHTSAYTSTAAEHMTVRRSAAGSGTTIKINVKVMRSSFCRRFSVFSFQNSVIELIGGHCSAQMSDCTPLEYCTSSSSCR